MCGRLVHRLLRFGEVGGRTGWKWRSAGWAAATRVLFLTYQTLVGVCPHQASPLKAPEKVAFSRQEMESALRNAIVFVPLFGPYMVVIILRNNNTSDLTRSHTSS